MNDVRKEDEIMKLKNALYYQQNFLQMYGDSIKSEHGMTFKFIEDMYREAKLSFPIIVTKRIEDVLEFHKALIVDRKDYLAPEMVEISKKILELTLQMALLEKENGIAR